MWSTYLLIFLMLCVGVAGWFVFLWAVKSGQFDDVEGPKYRMLDDEQDARPSGRGKNGPARDDGLAKGGPAESP